LNRCAERANQPVLEQNKNVVVTKRLTNHVLNLENTEAGRVAGPTKTGMQLETRGLAQIGLLGSTPNLEKNGVRSNRTVRLVQAETNITKPFRPMI
jgi:hypothetical protein